MSRAKRQPRHVPLRRLILLGWAVALLLIVAPALAQDGGPTAAGPQIGQAAPGTPTNLTEVATKLVPLLVGAALIERLLEFLFNLAESYLLRAGGWLHTLMEWVNGTALVDAREIYRRYDKLREALLAYQTGLRDEQTTPVNPDSDSIEEWPLAQVQAEFERYAAKVARLDAWLRTTTKSVDYVNRRKNVAAGLGMVLGIALAAVAGVRLLQPLDFVLKGVGGDVFDIFDLLAAGVLMGLGTDYVHQVVAVLTKSQRYLSAAAGRPAPETVTLDLGLIRQSADSQISGASTVLDERLNAIEEALVRLGARIPPDSSQPPST